MMVGGEVRDQTGEKTPCDVTDETSTMGNRNTNRFDRPE
jgi:hypothetical protein